MPFPYSNNLDVFVFCFMVDNMHLSYAPYTKTSTTRLTSLQLHLRVPKGILYILML